MAPALGYNAFGLTNSLHHAKLDSKPLKPTIAIYARAKPKDGPSDVEEGSSKPNPFSFDFSKITKDAKALIPVVTSPTGSMFTNPRRKDSNTVFVAGATGQVGARVAQMLLRKGFAVRAGVPELESAQEIARLALTYKIISAAESKRLNAVESTFDDPESIAKAIGPASKIVVTIGPTENGPAASVSTDDALNVVRAAGLAAAGHVAIIYDSSASFYSSSSSTYNVEKLEGFLGFLGITSFISNFSNLFARSQSLSLKDFLEKLAETDVRFTVIKAAIAEDYDGLVGSDGILVQKEGTISETKVAMSQIAKLVADVFADTSVAENKVVEVSSSSLATSKPVAELFSGIPEDGRRKTYAEALSKAKAEEEEASITSEKAQAAANGAEAKPEAADSTLDSLLSKAKDFGDNGGFSWKKLSSQLATAVPQNPNNGKPKTQIATVRGRAKARSLTAQKAAKPKPKQTEAKVEVRNPFRSLFKQETIYIDDD